MHDVGHSAPALYKFLIHAKCVNVPFPRIFKCFELRSRASTVLFREEDVVVLIRIERRVEVDEINRLFFDVTPENVEVVAVVKVIHRKESSGFELSESSAIVRKCAKTY